MDIDFAMWATDEETARQSWIAAGILKDAPGWVYTANYQGLQHTHSWGGKSSKPTGNTITDAQGNTVPEMAEVAGWHANVRVTGQVAEAMTAGLGQFNPDGSLKDIWERTWAAYIFNLTEVETDPTTGFPTGYRSTATGVRYCDPTAFRSPSNVIA